MDLSPQERERASRFRFRRDRTRFVAGRLGLRTVLGRYLGCAPKRIVLGSGTSGKPYSIKQPRDWRLFFNLSHSEDRAVLAVTDGLEVGIDIERSRPLDWALAPYVLSEGEQRQISGLDPRQRRTLLLAAWTAKEACLKALGTGLLVSPTEFEFDLMARGGPRLLRVGGDATEAEHWSVRPLDAILGFVGSLAARGRDLHPTWRSPQESCSRNEAPLETPRFFPLRSSGGASPLLALHPKA